MTNKQLRAFLDLIMVSDPWPNNVAQPPLEELADTESMKRGYKNWIVAYHELGRDEPAPPPCGAYAGGLSVGCVLRKNHEGFHVHRGAA